MFSSQEESTSAEFCSLQVETSDHARLRIKLGMNNHFDVDLNDPESTKAIFSISDFIGYACRNVGKYCLLLDPVVRKVGGA